VVRCRKSRRSSSGSIQGDLSGQNSRTRYGIALVLMGRLDPRAPREVERYFGWRWPCSWLILYIERGPFKRTVTFDRHRFIHSIQGDTVHRFILDSLQAWKSQHRRKPLILRGARQVGKTWAVVQFGRTRFEGTTHVVDLEKRLMWHRIFEGDLSARKILSQLELLLDARIVPGKDLLFFDEIQSCPRAITALRYFYEECPELHVVAAGSLLEFTLKEVSFPVGRIQFLEMFPMTFAEFLLATGKELAAGTILAPPGEQPESVHRMLLDELRRYMFIGGMPECVLTYANTGGMRDVIEVQAELVDAFRQDFPRYSPLSDKHCLTAVFSSIAKSVGRQLKYTGLAEGFTHPTIKKAVDLFALARLIRKVPATSPAGLPLGASASSRKFKAILLDVGLMQSITGMTRTVGPLDDDLLDLHEGALAEQFVGQELLAAGQGELYYWAREARGSNAEGDHLIVKEGRIHPVEIKSGSAGRLRSLHALLSSYPDCPCGYVLSTGPCAKRDEQRLRFVPLYYAYAIGRPES